MLHKDGLREFVAVVEHGGFTAKIGILEGPLMAVFCYRKLMRVIFRFRPHSGHWI